MVISMVQRVPDQAGDGLGPLLELLGGGGVPGDVLLRHAAGAHGPPFVVVAPQPHLGDSALLLVLVDIHGVDVAVVVDDGHFFRMVVVQGFRRLCF